jgi:phosphoglycerol transferase
VTDDELTAHPVDEPEPTVVPTAPGTVRPDDRLFPVRARRMALEAVLAAGVPWIWAVLNYRLWDISPRVPVNATDDARLITNLVKNIADQGWWTTNPDLGYPVGQQLYDFPHGGETWQLAILRFLSLFTKEPGLLMNAYFFIGIGVAGLAAYLALRHLRFGVGPALIASTALTWLPFRLGHSQWHLFRTSFWWVPLAIVVVLWVIHWRERFLVDPDPAPRSSRREALTWTLRHNLRVRRVLLFGLMVLVLGMSETMTTSFTMVLLAVSGLLGAIRRREPVTLLVQGLAIAAIGLVFFVGMASTLRFVAQNGTNADAGRREVIEQELYGLKLSDMLLPDPSHRDLLGVALGDPSREVRDNTKIPSEGGQSIGLLGAAGFVGAVIHVLTHGWGGRRRDLRPLHDRRSLRDDVSLLATVGFLVATVSGGAIFLSLLGFSQVRVWNRMSLLIGFCSLIFALTWLEAGWARVRPRLTAVPARAALGTALVAVLIAFVLWDGSHVQFRPPGGRFGLDYERNDERWVADADYAALLDEAMPDGSAVFQFPIIRFPEAPPPGQMQDYDHLRAWIHLEPGKLKWSYGAMKGRPDGDWQLKIREQIGEEGAIPLLIGLGFDGLWVDTWGYDDYGLRVRTAFDAMLGVEPILSADERIRFYDLRPYRDELAAEGQTQDVLEAEALRQLGVTPGD